MARYEDLDGKVVLVTGASRGLGKEMIRAFHSQGCKVALNYNSSKEQAEKTVKQLGDGVEVFQADVASRKNVRKMVREIESRLGPVDILVNNAGISYHMEFEKMIESKFDRMWKVNVLGSVNCSLEVLRNMKKTKSGVIINIASHAGLGNPRPYGTFYAVTKSALIILTKRMALELGKKYKIRVNAIAPGVVQVDSRGMKMNEGEALEYEEQLGLRRILRLKGLPRHVADAALFLSSKSSEFMTGQVLVVDGGRLDSLPRSM